VTGTFEAAVEQPTPARGAPTSGARSGALLAAASGTAIVVNYAFLLAAGRVLGSEEYGSLAALLGLLALVLIPAGALQMAVSREISRLLAGGNTDGAERFATAMLRRSLVATVPLVVVALALAVPLADLLNIRSTGVLVLAETTLVTALVFPTAIGVLQGYQRFQALAAMYVVPLVVRLLLFGLLSAAGYRLGGAVFACVVGAVAGVGLALLLIREPMRLGLAGPQPHLREFVRYLGPVVVGLVGTTLLTHIDILVVKARFSGDAPGAYAAASAFARVGFFLPAIILTVLFPRTAARQARGEETEDILGRSLLATAAFCGGLAVFYAATGVGIVTTSFGADFAEGGHVLAPFALAIGLFSLANVLVGYHLSRGETRYAWIVAAAVPVQVAVLAFVPSSLHGVVWSNVAVGAALLAAHELLIGSSVPAVRAGLRNFKRSIEARRLRPVGLEAGAVLAGMTVFVCLLFLPMVAAIGSTVIGRGSDATGTVWWLWSLQHESGYHLFGSMHHTLTGAPFGWEGDNGLNIQWLLPYYPAYLATKVVGPVAAHNLVLLSGYVLSGAAMYALVRYLGCTRLVAAWAGLVYVAFPWHLERTPHASLVHLEFLPLLLLAMVVAARSPSWSRFALVGAATVACWLTSGYFGAMAVVGAGAFAAGVALTKARRRIRFLLIGSTAATVGGSLLVGVLSEISGVGRGSGLHRYASDLSVYGLRPAELVVPAARNFLFGHWTRSFLETRQHFSNPTETTNYLGILTIALALTWLVLAWRNRTTMRPLLRLATPALAAVTVVSLLLAFPSPVSVFGHDVWMPSRLLWQIVPPFRVPSRWVVMAMAALVPLAALTLQAGVTRLGRVGLRWWGIQVAPAVLVVAAMAVSFLELGVNPSENRFRADHTPPEYAALARTPSGVVADYPLFQNIDRLFWQIRYHRPNLSSEAFGAPPDDARRALINPAMPGAASQLALLGVTAIVTHRDALGYALGVKDVPNARWGPGYQLVARTPDGSSTWRVVAPPAPALVTPYGGLGGPDPEADNVPGYPLSSSSGVGYLALRAKQPGVVRLTFDAAPPQGSQKLLRVADEKIERPFPLTGPTHISVLVEVPRGFSLVLLKTDPPPTSAADAIVFTKMYAERASGTPELHAVLEDADPGF
jgi:O-antigen/teichoic acid export membrane protein